MNYSTYVLDGDGVVYELLGQKKRIIILTNNALKDPAGYAKKINELYFSGDELIKPEWVVSPLDVVVPFFEERRRKMAQFSNKVMVIGGGAPLKQKLEEGELELTENPKYASWVVVSEIVKLRDFNLIPKAYSAIHDHGAQILATNSDPFDRRENKSYPVTGAVVSSLRETGKRPHHVFWLGKGRKEIYEILFQKFNISQSERDSVLTIGDRIITDIYGSNNLGIDSVLVDSPFGSDHIQDIPDYRRMAEFRLELLNSDLYWKLREEPQPQDILQKQIEAEREKYIPTYCISSLESLLKPSLKEHKYTYIDSQL
jgi:ribonucleotide monophosphatase NagD (HAD superfamily)